MGLGAREEGAEGRYGEIPDQPAGCVCGGRYQYLSGQEEAHPVRLSRGCAGRVRHPAPPIPPEKTVSAVHDDEPDHASAAWRSRLIGPDFPGTPTRVRPIPRTAAPP